MAQIERYAIASYLRALPKVELHLHLEGALSPNLILKLAERNRLKLPFKNPDDFRAIYQYKSFKDFSNALLLGVACLRKPEDFADAVFNLGEELITQNVHYAEITWTPQFYLNRGFPLHVIIEAMNGARQQLERKNGLILRWIPDIVRSYPEHANAIARWASLQSSRDAGIVALGLGGPEKGHPANLFTKPFSIAREAGLPANPHSGEGAGAESVWDTIRNLAPTRLGHGVRSIEDDQLIEYLRLHKITLEVCITSNIKLGVYPTYESHPVKKLIAAGCSVVLNTDDPVLFNTSLSEEYNLAINRCGLSIDDIEASILCGIHSSYLAESEKTTLTQDFRDKFKQLRLKFDSENLAVNR